MKRLLSILVSVLLFLSASADERGLVRLQRLSLHYSSLGSYRLCFELKADGVEQQGVLRVSGNDMYMRVADTEVYVLDSLRYEVHGLSKEIIVDRADVYESELVNPLQGLSKVAEEFDVEEQIVEGRIELRLVPKSSGDAITIRLTADGECVERVIYGTGTGAVTIGVERATRSTEAIPKFDIKRYEGFEMIDFR